MQRIHPAHTGIADIRIGFLGNFHEVSMATFSVFVEPFGAG
jgi:hypothetical protein